MPTIAPPTQGHQPTLRYAYGAKHGQNTGTIPFAARHAPRCTHPFTPTKCSPIHKACAPTVVNCLNLVPPPPSARSKVSAQNSAATVMLADAAHSAPSNYASTVASNHNGSTPKTSPSNTNFADVHVHVHLERYTTLPHQCPIHQANVSDLPLWSLTPLQVQLP